MIRRLGLSVPVGLACGDPQCSANEAQEWLGKYAFTQQINICAIRSLGASTSTAECIRKATGITRECAQCFGDATQCGRDHCMSHCLADTASVACIKCTVGNGCADMLDECTGFSGPPVPTRAATEDRGLDSEPLQQTTADSSLALATGLTLALAVSIM